MEALTTNGTDEGVLRAWLEREFRHWQRAFEASLRQEIDELRRSHLNDQPGRPAPSGEPVERFSRALVELLTFSRSTGALPDNSLRRLREAAEPKAGTGAAAVDEAFAEVGQQPAGDEDLHESWARCLMLLFYHHAVDSAASYPGPDALYRERREWARRTLGGYANSGALEQALEAYLDESGISPVVAAVVDHPAAEVLRYHESIPEHRIGLVTGAGARWLVGAVERT